MAILDVPYRTYFKQVVFRQAVANIKHAKAVLTLKPQLKVSGWRSQSRSS